MKWCAVFSSGRVLNDQTSQDHNLHRCQGVHHCSWAETHRWRNSEENTWRPEALQSMLASKFTPVMAKVQSHNWWLKSLLCSVLSLLTIESYQSSFLTSSNPPTNAWLQVKLNRIYGFCDSVSPLVAQDDQLLEDSKTLGDCGFTNQTARPQAPATVGLAFRINGMNSLLIHPCVYFF